MNIRSIAGAALVLLATTGCGSLDVCERVEAGLAADHVSHPTAGRPFGPKTEEDSLNTVGGYGRCSFSQGVWTEVGLGWKVGDGGFYGPDMVSELRVGVKLWERE